MLAAAQVVTDSAANCKVAGRLVEEKYPHITWSPCVAHMCDLWLEDLFKMDYFAGVHKDCKDAVTFIRCARARAAAQTARPMGHSAVKPVPAACQEPPCNARGLAAAGGEPAS